MTEPAEHWRDDPITSPAQDRLGRVELAERVATLIAETFSPDSSVVHGLVGPWGSGKSSVLALVEQQLQKRAEEWVVVRFSPWATSDLNGMLAEFHAAIIEVLPKRKAAERFKKGLAGVMRTAAPLAGIAGAAFSVPLVSEATAKVADAISHDGSWIQQFTSASDALRKLKIKILVIADDIDRLHGDELLNFLKLVRLVGRFPGMSYLIAYDDAGLLASIEAVGTSVSDPQRAQDFLEKFVQYPVYLPPLLDSQVFTLLNDALMPVIQASGHRLAVDEGRLSLARAWTDLLDSPRAISRFVAQLRLVLPLFKTDEVDLVDVILLTLLRLHAPRVYDNLLDVKEVLTASRAGKDPFPWERVIGGRVPPTVAPAIEELVQRLFPVAGGRPPGQAAGARVANPEYFDRYLLQGIPDDDIADRSVHFAIEQATAGDARFVDALLLGARSTAKAQVVVSKLQRFSGWGGDEAVTPIALLEVVLRRLDLLPRETVSRVFRPHQGAVEWAGRLMLRLPIDVTDAQVADALQGCSNPDDRRTLLETIASAADGVLPAGVRAVAAIQAESLVEAFIAHVRGGDAADPDAPVERWLMVIRALAPEVSRERIRAAVADGLGPEDLAARFVRISRWRGIAGDEVRHEIRDLWSDAYRDLVPEEVVLPAARDDAINSNDVSWPSRRQFALVELAKVRIGPSSGDADDAQ